MTKQKPQYFNPYPILHAFNISNLTELRGLYAKELCVML